KDDLKEAIAEPFPTGDREWSRQLGRAAYGVLYVVAERLLSAGSGLVLESNFRRESAAPLSALARLAPTVVIVCRIADALRRERFTERAVEGRHRVHVDDAILAEWSSDDAEFLIDIGVPRLMVDTTDGYTPDLEHIATFTRGATVAVAVKREWPADWSERVRGKDCAMCADGRAEIAHGSSRIFAGRLSDAYLIRSEVGQPGYSVVIWRGRHVSDPTELSQDEAGAYFEEVLRVGRAIERHYRPIKMNFQMLGNSLPHLHTHVVPRYPDDGEPGHPAHFMRADMPDEPLIPEQAYTHDVAALRELLRR
ncbi:MAG TPA: HIT domain-containing protein, partial [Candidatus Limnocylindria bacterium]|nr:HIT domain-containing protein [Candidatus Limnocylindria bacterium]